MTMLKRETLHISILCTYADNFTALTVNRKNTNTNICLSKKVCEKMKVMYLRNLSVLTDNVCLTKVIKFLSSTDHSVCCCGFDGFC